MSEGPAGDGRASPGVKICGLTRRQDAERAAREGAAFLGVVLVPGTPRAMSPGEGRRITEGLGLPVAAVTADLPPEAAAAAADSLGADVLQLHGSEPPETLHLLRELGSWRLWKALRLKEETDLAEGVARYGDAVDALLLDGWHPQRLGGAGRSFSWEIVERMRRAIPSGLPLVVAGGLTPVNVAEAVRRLRPAVVDVSSGVEISPGIKDPDRVRAFLQAVARG